MSIATINPATGETKNICSTSDDALAQKIELAQQAFEQYRYTSYEQHSEWLEAAAQILSNGK